MKKVFAEIGIGNPSFLSTEYEEDEEEFRVPHFIVPQKIKGVYLRIWVLKHVYILSTRHGFEISHKDRKAFKFLFGISGEETN